jgi:hypothetical protein
MEDGVGAVGAAGDRLGVRQPVAPVTNARTRPP